MTAKPRSKYRNVRVEVDGLKFDSKAEAARWQQLRLLEKAGRIRELRRQVRYPLVVNQFLSEEDGDTIGNYVADFDYIFIDEVNNFRVTEDVKGMITDLSKWKLKHFAAQYGRAVQIVRMR
jgi:predicted DNA binding CopG/RHH family protein